ncbi:MAG: diguanylate cyclase [Clostridia bacterium]|nr:diguanylate cyclase [Clostridia bacterium]
MIMTMVIIIVLVIVVVSLVIYNVSIYKKLQSYNNLSQKVVNLNVLQDFMNTIGEVSTVDQKIEKINEILIERYEIKYSTIVVFDGTEYKIKASNVDRKHWEALKKLQEVEIFKDSISTATPKYVTVNNEKERLPYQQMEFGRAKSAIFFPLYIDNVYIGYWIIESGVPHDFDNVDTTIFEIVRENIITVLKTTVHQRTLESLVRTDLFTGLNSAEYLYSEGKKQIEKYTISTVCMFRITNIEKINQEFSREMGNKVITEVARYVEENISKEYVFVRYMGPKFVIVFSGLENEGVAEFLNDIKIAIENMKIRLTDDTEPEKIVISKTKKKVKEKPAATPKLNFVLSTYYKGTGLEELLKKLEEYIDSADKSESEINNI